MGGANWTKVDWSSFKSFSNVTKFSKNSMYFFKPSEKFQDFINYTRLLTNIFLFFRITTSFIIRWSVAYTISSIPSWWYGTQKCWSISSLRILIISLKSEISRWRPAKRGTKWCRRCCPSRPARSGKICGPSWHPHFPQARSKACSLWCMRRLMLSSSFQWKKHQRTSLWTWRKTLDDSLWTQLLLVPLALSVTLWWIKMLNFLAKLKDSLKCNWWQCSKLYFLNSCQSCSDYLA